MNHFPFKDPEAVYMIKSQPKFNQISIYNIFWEVACLCVCLFSIGSTISGYIINKPNMRVPKVEFFVTVWRSEVILNRGGGLKYDPVVTSVHPFLA